jgi:preprotein translocase subunit SecG
MLLALLLLAVLLAVLLMAVLLLQLLAMLGAGKNNGGGGVKFKPVHGGSTKRSPGSAWQPP